MDELTCPMCGGFHSGLILGFLGNRAWFRCRDCGIDFSVDADSLPPPEYDFDHDFEDEFDPEDDLRRREAIEEMRLGVA